MVQMVDENKSFFRDHQISQAKSAWELLHALGCPSIAYLKQVIKINSIKNIPVTTEDIALAKKIYGPDLASLKGKTVHQSPAPVVNDVIEIPRELIPSQYNVDLFIDTMFVNSLEFFTRVSKPMKFKTCDYTPNRKVVKYKKALTRVICQYTDTGFSIRCIFSDQELQRVLQNLKEATPYIDFTLENSNEHVPEAEQNNHTLQ